jgi:nucleoside-diphosphate-sugar epimerase
MQGMDMVFHLAALIAIAESPNTIGEEINIASQQEISVGDLAQMMIDEINPSARIISDDIRLRPEKSEVERLLGSNEKIRRLTGWHPKIDLKQGIRETIAWFKNAENLRRYKWNCYNV